MKRLLPLLLILLLIPCLIVPASASTQGVIDAIWDTHDELGEWLGTTLGDLRDLLTDVVTYLGWIDQEVSSIETNVLKILQEIYTQGTLTIGECVKGIRSYIVTINEKLETGMEYTIGVCVGNIHEIVAWMHNNVASIARAVESLPAALEHLVSGDSSKADDIVDDVSPLETEIQDMEDVLATSPTIDQEGFDTALDDINGKFNGITSDENGAMFFGALGDIANTAPFSVIVPTSAMLAVLSFALFGRTF